MAAFAAKQPPRLAVRPALRVASSRLPKASIELMPIRGMFGIRVKSYHFAGKPMFMRESKSVSVSMARARPHSEYTVQIGEYAGACTGLTG